MRRYIGYIGYTRIYITRRIERAPGPEGKEGRAFIYISFESGRPVITAADSPWASAIGPKLLSLSLSLSLSLFLSLFLCNTPEELPVRDFAPSALLSFTLLLSLSYTSASPSSPRPISGPHYRIPRVPSEKKTSKLKTKEEEEEDSRARSLLPRWGEKKGMSLLHSAEYEHRSGEAAGPRRAATPTELITAV